MFQEDFFKPQWFELEGDYSHLNNIYINGEDDQTKIDELCDLVYDKEGKHKIQFISGPTKDWDFFVECGFIP
jgi:hypothetical protein